MGEWRARVLETDGDLRFDLRGVSRHVLDLAIGANEVEYPLLAGVEV